MNLRYRLTLGIGVLFVLILLLGGLSVGYVRQLSAASGNILADNYNSVHYAEEMLRSLDRLSQDSSSRATLIRSLSLQRQNITEVDESEATASLGRRIAALTDTVTPDRIRLVRSDLYRIMDLNMASIRMKSSEMEARAADAVWWLTVMAVLCVVLAAAFLVQFPAVILRPIDKLKRGITEIANHNYEERLDFGGNREFREVAESFNDMACKLSEYRRSSLDSLMIEKKRIEGIVNSLHEPIVGLDSERNILFMNDEACTILNLKRGEVIGRKAAEVALNNDLLRRLIRELYSEPKEDEGQKEPLKIYADNKESYFQMENIPLHIVPVGGQRKQFIGNVIILNNVTRYKELDSAKTNFISTVSHEMKTPISSILMSLQLLGDNRLGSLNDTWYELKGSETGKAETLQDYAVTYYRPRSAGMETRWTDNRGGSGSIDYLKQFHDQGYYYPAWVEAESYTLRGTRLEARNYDQSGNGSYWVNAAYEWGYADNFSPIDRLTDDDNVSAAANPNHFRIADAVTFEGEPAGLEYIDFVKVQTGVNAKSGWLGELSTEVFGFYDYRMRRE